jgi:hypothetical protein
VTEQELKQLAKRERITVRGRTKGNRIYWYAYSRWRGDLHSAYLTADSRLPGFTEADFLKKVRGLPGRSGTERLVVQLLPGRAVLIEKGNRKMALSAEEFSQLAELAPARVEMIDQEAAAAASPAVPPDAHGEPADAATAPDDERDPVALLQAELAMTRDERDRLAELPDRMFALLNSYQEHISRAQNYKPTSDRGEAVSPLLCLIEQIYLTLIESEPDD